MEFLGNDGAVDRFDGDSPERGFLLFDYFGDAGNSSTGADTRHQHQIMLVRLRYLSKLAGKPVGMQNRRQLPQRERITLRLLHDDGFVKQFPLAQVRQNEIQEMDMTDT